jgi:hypothetical protein
MEMTRYFLIVPDKFKVFEFYRYKWKLIIETDHDYVLINLYLLVASGGSI